MTVCQRRSIQRESKRKKVGHGELMTVAYSISSSCWTCVPHKAALETINHWNHWAADRKWYWTISKSNGADQVLLPVWWLEHSLLSYNSDQNICLHHSICSEWRFPRLYILLIYYLTNTWRGVMVSGTFWITTLIPPTLLSLHLFPTRILLNSAFDPCYLWNKEKKTLKTHFFPLFVSNQPKVNGWYTINKSSSNSSKISLFVVILILVTDHCHIVTVSSFFFFEVTSLKINMKNSIDFTIHSHKPLRNALSSQHKLNQPCSTKQQDWQNILIFLLSQGSKASVKGHFQRSTCLFFTLPTTSFRIGSTIFRNHISSYIPFFVYYWRTWSCMSNDSHLSKLWKNTGRQLHAQHLYIYLMSIFLPPVVSFFTSSFCQAAFPKKVYILCP